MIQQTILIGASGFGHLMSFLSEHLALAVVLLDSGLEPVAACHVLPWCAATFCDVIIHPEHSPHIAILVVLLDRCGSVDNVD